MGLSTTGAIAISGESLVEVSPGSYILSTSTLAEPVRFSVSNTITSRGLSSFVIKSNISQRVPDSNIVETGQYHEVFKLTDLVTLPELLVRRAVHTAILADATLRARLELGLT